MKSLAQLCCEQHAEILPAHILQMPEIRELLDRTLSTWNQLCLFGEIHEYDSKTGLPVRVSKCHTDEYNCTWETNWTINWETRVVHYTHNALDRQAKLDIKFDIDASNSTYVIKSVEHMVGRGTGSTLTGRNFTICVADTITDSAAVVMGWPPCTNYTIMAIMLAGSGTTRAILIDVNVKNHQPFDFFEIEMSVQ